MLSHPVPDREDRVEIVSLGNRFLFSRRMELGKRTDQQHSYGHAINHQRAQSAVKFMVIGNYSVHFAKLDEWFYDFRFWNKNSNPDETLHTQSRSAVHNRPGISGKESHFGNLALENEKGRGRHFSTVKKHDRPFWRRCCTIQICPEIGVQSVSKHLTVTHENIFIHCHAEAEVQISRFRR